MVIQWNDRMAEHVLDCLQKADDAMQLCARMKSDVESALADANPNRSDEALNAICDRFAEAANDLQGLNADIAALVRAIAKADAAFADAEKEIAGRADQIALREMPINESASADDRNADWITIQNDVPILL